MNKLTDIENILIADRLWGWGVSLGEWVKEGKELRCTSCQLQKQSQGCKVKTREIVDNTVITMYGVIWVLGPTRDHFVSYINGYHYVVYLRLINIISQL